MIVVRCFGGLGNQLFQYSTARALAHRHRVGVKCDVSWYGLHHDSGTTSRTFELCRTRASSSELSRPEKARARLAMSLARCLGETRLARAVQRTATGFAVFHEPHFQYTPHLLRQSDNVILIGYWQSERYFHDIRPLLLRELVPREELAGRASDVAERIRREEHAVGIHVRRGDYAANPETKAYHGLCPVAYYEAAVRGIISEYPDAKLFLFSDEPGWCRRNLVLPRPFETVSSTVPSAAVTDLHLMSLCRHHVIANSSFGWWGAWLADRSGQTVIHPKRWFSDPSINTRDLVPTSWLGL